MKEYHFDPVRESYVNNFHELDRNDILSRDHIIVRLGLFPFDGKSIRIGYILLLNHSCIQIMTRGKSFHLKVDQNFDPFS